MENVAVAYVRVSTVGQVDKQGLKAQLEAVKNYANQNGYTIAEIFIEKGRSGALGLKEEKRDEQDEDKAYREALSNCLEYMETKGVTNCIIYELSRLARDLMLQETIVSMFQDKNFTLLSCLEPDLMENDPMRRAFRQFRGLMNEFEKSMITMRMRSGRIQNAKQGKHATGKIPMGYKSEIQDGKKVLVRVEEELAIVRKVFEYRDVYKLSFQRIADRLNAEGVRPKNWTPETPTQFYNSTVQKLYKNPKYQGRIVLKEHGQIIAEGVNKELVL